MVFVDDAIVEAEASEAYYWSGGEQQDAPN